MYDTSKMHITHPLLLITDSYYITCMHLELNMISTEAKKHDLIAGKVILEDHTIFWNQNKKAENYHKLET